MGKKSRKDGESKGEKSNGSSHTKKAILDEDKAVDPALALLFASSVSFPSRDSNYDQELIEGIGRPSSSTP